MSYDLLKSLSEVFVSLELHQYAVTTNVAFSIAALLLIFLVTLFITFRSRSDQQFIPTLDDSSSSIPFFGKKKKKLATKVVTTKKLTVVSKPSDIRNNVEKRVNSTIKSDAKKMVDTEELVSTDQGEWLTAATRKKKRTPVASTTSLNNSLDDEKVKSVESVNVSELPLTKDKSSGKVVSVVDVISAETLAPQSLSDNAAKQVLSSPAKEKRAIPVSPDIKTESVEKSASPAVSVAQPESVSLHREENRVVKTSYANIKQEQMQDSGDDYNWLEVYSGRASGAAKRKGKKGNVGIDSHSTAAFVPSIPPQLSVAGVPTPEALAMDAVPRLAIFDELGGKLVTGAGDEWEESRSSVKQKRRRARRDN